MVPSSPAPRSRASRRLRACAHAIAPVLLATSLGMGSEEIFSSQQEPQLRVAAVVLEKASLRLLSTPQHLEITAEDILRGHVDVPASTVFTLRCNVQNGMGFHVALDPQLVSGATVSGLNHVAQVNGSTGLLRMEGPHRQETRFELHWRLQLAPQAKAGVYPWPVQMDLEVL